MEEICENKNKDDHISSVSDDSKMVPFTFCSFNNIFNIMFPNTTVLLKNRTGQRCSSKTDPESKIKLI